MELIRKLGQLFMLGFEPTEPELVLPLLEQQLPGGVILFGHNVVSRDQVTNLCGGLQAAAGRLGLPPLLISIDQEGGRVTRLGSEICPAFPSNWEQGSAFALSSDSSPVSQQAKETARVLRELGINMNLAPVMDVVTVDGNEVISDRAYGSDTQLVSRLGVEYISALQEQGVIATTKHFPGHGHTDVDSHYGLPVIKLPEAELRNVHLAPFVAAINAGVDALMPAHIIYEAWDEWPTTLSHKLLTGLLREELGYRGVVITDDMNMHAISKHYPYPDSLVQALAAGVDILLVCSNPEVQLTARQTVHEALNEGRLGEDIIDAALARVAQLKQKYGLAREELA